MADAAYGQESVAFPEKRGLFLQLERLSNILCSSSDGTRSAEGWEQHRWALQQISLLVQSDISNCSEFLAFMRVFLRVPLQRHIEELRTVLCVEACNVVRSLAVHSTNRHAWQVATEWFVPSLLKLAARKGGTVVRAASETLSTLVKTSSFGPGALGELFRGCSASHAATRSLSFSVLKLLIQCTQNNEGVLPLSRYRADICRLLRAGMSDASEQTRACARDCYMTLLAAEHEIASALYRELDTSVKRALGRQQDGVPTGVHDTRRGLGEAHSCEALVTDCASSLPVMNQMESHGVPLGGGKEKTNEASVDDPSRVCAPDAADDDCCEVREMLMSPSWINRLQGARIIIRDLPRTKCKDKHAKLVIPLLCDPDSRVARVVVESLPLLSRLVPEAVKADLPRITSSLLAIISKGSGSAVCAARKQLVSAGKLFPIPVILGAVYRLLRDGDASATLKARALEYATYLYTSNTRLMHQLAPMKQAIAQVLRVLQNCNKDDLVHQAGVTSLTALYSEAKDAFLRVLLEHLSAEERNVAFGALEVAIPHLFQESQRRALGERLLQHRELPTQTLLDGVPLEYQEGSPAVQKVKSRQDTAFFVPATTTVSTKKHTAGVRATAGAPCRLKQHVEATGVPSMTAVGLTGVHCNSGRDPFICVEADDPLFCRRIASHNRRAQVAGKRLWESAASERPSSLLNSLARARDAVDTRSALDEIERAIVADPEPWASVFGRLIALLEKIIPDACEPNHGVRSRGLKLLHTAITPGVLCPAASRLLKTVFSLIRIGLDDPFPELQMDAAELLQFVITNGLYPLDHLLNALAINLELWLQTCGLFFSTRGWLVLLESVEVAIQRAQSGLVPRRSLPRNGTGITTFSSGIVSDAVVGRLCGALARAVRHGVPEVRLTAVRIYASVLKSFGQDALPFMSDLTEAQRRLILLYCNKALPNSSVSWRDLWCEMPAADHVKDS